jgi:hypothetical protein
MAGSSVFPTSPDAYEYASALLRFCLLELELARAV